MSFPGLGIANSISYFLTFHDCCIRFLGMLRQRVNLEVELIQAMLKKLDLGIDSRQLLLPQDFADSLF